MKKVIALVLSVAMLLSVAGCSKGGGEKKYTTYTTLYDAELATLNYLKSNTTNVIHLAYNTIDGLVEFDQYGVMIPSLAESWKQSDDLLTYTFKLRKGVKWYNSQKEEYAEVKAQDFVDGLKWVLTKDNASSNASNVYNSILGAKAYYDGEVNDFSTVGVKAVDEYTVEYKLKQTCPYFLKMLTNPSYYPVNGDFLAECGDTFGTSAETTLYCGAYICTSFEPEYQRVYEMNDNYWNKGIISIKTITYRYNKEATSNGAELFLRGETQEVSLSSTIVDQWMNDKEKSDNMHPSNLTNMSYYMGFNFNPTYESKYNPSDWTTAVNNVNFRKAFFYAFDRDAATMTLDPYNYKDKTQNTYTRKNLVSSGSVDYTMLSGLDEYTNGTLFNTEKAVQYKNKAMGDLKGKVSFPIQVVMPYSTTNSSTANRVQVIEQQMEGVLGTDFMDIVLVPYSGSSFNSDVRNAGTWSFMELGWGPDFADPMSMFDPLLKANNAKKWGSIYLAKEYYNESLGYGEFEKMALEADSIVDNEKERYEKFAAAEKLLLDEALVIPAYTSGGGWTASYLDPFSGYTGQFGANSLRKLKGAKVLDKPMNTEDYQKAYEKYLDEQAKARQK